ncbi:toll-interacting protein-like isoform X2 [Oratosquilla oratoria]|uniref:toll-interacting protein-like isoform X2 n=1 Tax=Oratosquilla oratoria TaxID=337810 RepID=UPI003F7762E8
MPFIIVPFLVPPPKPSVRMMNGRRVQAAKQGETHPGSLKHNHGTLRMDPYVRLKFGPYVLETDTHFGGGTDPEWNATFIVNRLPKGVKSVDVEVLDSRVLRPDERVAWSNVPLPEQVFKGETVEDAHPLSGPSGSEGFVNIRFEYSKETYTPSLLKNATDVFVQYPQATSTCSNNNNTRIPIPQPVGCQ